MMTPLSLASTILLAPLATAQSPIANQARPVPVQPPVTDSLLASPVTVIFTSVATSPLSDVPGVPGAKFSGFDRPNLSPNGLNYVITADTDLPAGQDDVLIVNDVVLLRESETPSFLEPGNTLGNFDQGASINDSGQVAFNNDTTASNAEDEMVVHYDGIDTFTIVARENSPVVGGPAGWIYDSLNTAVITDAGVVGYESDSIDGTAGGNSTDNAMFFGPTPFAQKGVDIPIGQLDGGMVTWGDFDFEDLYINADGSSYILQGDLGGAIGTDDMVVIDGVVVVQEGFAIPGGDPLDIVDNGGISAVFMSGNGDWTAEGDFDLNDEEWVLYNGVMVARENDPIHVGSTETWGVSAFFASTCNSVGDYLVGGFNDSDDTMLDGVVVLNGERVVLREGDPIDLDGNGLFDEGLFLNSFSTDDFRLTDDLQLYFVASLREAGSVATVGNIFCKVDLREAVGSSLCAGQPNSTGGESRLGASGSNLVAGNDLTLQVEGLPSGVTGFFLTSLETIFVANPGGSAGDLCIGSFVLGRYGNSVQTSSATGTVSQGIDLSMTPVPTGFTAVAAGETRHWQFWHRDTVGGMATSNFSSALSVTFE